MPTVREVTYDLFRKQGLTTMFGNPGSTELPMLQEFPDDFDYVLGLQEAAVVAMADGYAQMTGKPSLVNLHTAPGLGNAVGAIFNAQANHSPVVITVGQQARAHDHDAVEPDQPRRDHACRSPYVKFAFEPPRAEDVPLAIAHAIHLASLPPMGPVMVSLPMDDWDVEMDAAQAAAVIDRKVTGRATADPEQVSDLADRIIEAKNPIAVAGPDIDAADAWDEMIALSENQNLGVWAAPATGGGRLGFPEEPSALARRPAARGRPGRGDPEGPRPDHRGRLFRLRLLPEHPRALPRRRLFAGRDHLRPGRSCPRADG